MSIIGGIRMNCKKCGQEIDKNAVVCTQCGCKIKKPIFKKWWFWVVVVVAIITIGSSGNNESAPNSDTTSGQNQVEEVVYEVVDLQTMFDELESNAMKAENNYKNKYVEFECKIKSFDSDGAYVSVEPTNASEWNFSSAMCYIKNDIQKEFLIQKNVGDKITVKGKINSIGEVMGYSLDIKEVF